MGFTVYDYRTDVRNVLVTPEIRSRFLRMEPGQAAGRHSHDLGHEIFLILEGQCEFEIDGETQILSPGQMCIALAHQPHSVRVIGDEPMTMYLSVTPHIHPTHTGRTEDGGRLPPAFAPSSAYDVEQDMNKSIEELIDHHVDEAQAVAQAAQAAADVQRDMAAKLKTAIADGDKQAATDARNAMWEALYTMFQGVYNCADGWNELAPRATEIESA
ncbi:cupin domain-containing protein [Candidatus Poribacteria bacterium]|nr:cupin domain-containing protein [Candidatus Poribacteria bacterium]